MSYNGLEYNQFGGMDMMGGGGYNEGAYNVMGGGAMGGMDYGGGGFMTDAQAAKGSGSDRKQNRDKQSLLPVSVKQLLGAVSEDDVFKIDGAELSTVKLIGMIDSSEEFSTNHTFKLNDGSGVVECKQWIEKDSGMIKGNKVSDNTLVRVVGNLREYEGRMHVLVYDATPVQDWNELTHHLLEVLLTHLQQTRGPIPGTAGAAGASPQQRMMGSPNRMGMNALGGQMQPVGGSSMGMSMGMGMGGGMNNMGGAAVDTLADKVYNVYLRGCAGDHTGMHYHQALRALQATGTNISIGELIQKVMELSNDGKLYTTIDEEHHMPTDL